MPTASSVRPPTAVSSLSRSVSRLTAAVPCEASTMGMVVQRVGGCRWHGQAAASSEPLLHAAPTKGAPAPCDPFRHLAAGELTRLPKVVLMASTSRLRSSSSLSFSSLRS